MRKIFKISVILVILLNTSCRTDVLYQPLLGVDGVKLLDNALIGSWKATEGGVLVIREHVSDRELFTIEIALGVDFFSADFYLGREDGIYFLNILESSITINNAGLFKKANLRDHYILVGATFSANKLTLMPAYLDQLSKRLDQHIIESHSVSSEIDISVLSSPWAELISSNYEVIKLDESLSMYKDLKTEHDNFFPDDDWLVFYRE